jgi:hypothetical protein
MFRVCVHICKEVDARRRVASITNAFETKQNKNWVSSDFPFPHTHKLCIFKKMPTVLLCYYERRDCCKNPNPKNCTVWLSIISQTDPRHTNRNKKKLGLGFIRLSFPNTNCAFSFIALRIIKLQI